MMEIEKVNKTSRGLAKANQELEESRMVAVSDQARTAKRLLLVSSQLEHTEQQLFNLTKEINDGQKDSDLLRVERIKREALQEREDAGRLQIEALQDELHEVQRSERSLQQKLFIMQTKYEAIGKRHELLKRQQQELDLVRESREALAWLKETTDRLCSPPQGSLGQAIQQEKASQGSTPINIYQTSPSSSPPYHSVITDPPLVAQNQLVSLIKELATANSTLRTELGEYRDLLQDARNEVINLRSQVEDYEQGHAFDCCGQGFSDDSPSDIAVSKSTFNALATLDVGLQQSKDLSGELSGSPPPYMTTPVAPPTEQHLHHHFHLPGVRGNIFGELERRYNQDQQQGSSAKRRHRHSSKKESHGRRSSRDHAGTSHPRHIHAHHTHHDARTTTATVSTSTSTSEVRRGLGPIQGHKYAPHSMDDAKARADDGGDAHCSRSRGKKSLYTDADLDMLDSGSDRDFDDRKVDEHWDPAELHSEFGDSGSDQEPGFVAKFAEVCAHMTLHIALNGSARA
ncbi:hypothetical protein BC939DRAFT_7642 [Gamsiella multidivaricata]|uniref:uncharacterized protein n=1 Tax=Gamsiella multidivaricata TaxID=101098 RepID=UPI00221F2765|nr:uncharacterized protein BC939DRAFT_7642 [Gamsiella multidivaricata]KAG0365707.1 hypothetical protein BGZ54_006287 [Gamsiella multidivaricata]KAI7832838.1 hypothetical protein BC939DRAFT_7642 [Gamsiella multidivaricata]